MPAHRSLKPLKGFARMAGDLAIGVKIGAMSNPTMLPSSMTIARDSAVAQSETAHETKIGYWYWNSFYRVFKIVQKGV